jgi:hypothetical protein
MGYPISAKAIEIAHNLANQLLQRGSAGTLATLNGGPIPVTEAFDASGYPTITFGTLGSTDLGAFIRVIPQPWPTGTDILGNQSAVYTPTVIQIATEASPDGPLATTDFAAFLAILGESVTTGCRVETWNSASGTAPSDATFATPSNFVAAFESLQYPLVSNT